MQNKRVAYLIGAGGSHACIDAVGSPHGILMKHLVDEIAPRVRKLVSEGSRFQSLRRVVNTVVNEDADIEQLITFFDESPGYIHRQFAEKLRHIFEDVLRDKLMRNKKEFGEDRVGLYSALLDMYNIPELEESLNGILTLNYDTFIEEAADLVSCDNERKKIESERGLGATTFNGWHLLKLHGSFGWEESWPIRRRTLSSRRRPLWIPPGIRKETGQYPFNLAWGLAREVLNCDVLRVIGCSLGATDWHLMSLLFGTRHAHGGSDRPYTIEIIDSPWQASFLRETYPYLEVKSLFEIDTFDVGSNLIADLLNLTEPRPFESLAESVQHELVADSRGSNKNWFRMWLVKVGDALRDRLGETKLKTRTGAFRDLLEV